eukprot:TRINITY_DN21480_c1_g1_i3.p1 TRINITY_DN21480_c1_g1~~TRINITY_DN21480_c1_g1_i3.p1  ORF type:complete len:554 (+),score=56.68 TRINITY_DN21480_c1_g1_i3:147-1808(+)
MRAGPQKAAYCRHLRILSLAAAGSGGLAAAGALAREAPPAGAGGCEDRVRWWRARNLSFADCCVGVERADCFEDSEHNVYDCCERGRFRTHLVVPRQWLVDIRACEILAEKLDDGLLRVTLPQLQQWHCFVEVFGHVARASPAVLMRDDGPHDLRKSVQIAGPFGLETTKQVDYLSSHADGVFVYVSRGSLVDISELDLKKAVALNSTTFDVGAQLEEQPSSTSVAAYQTRAAQLRQGRYPYAGCGITCPVKPSESGLGLIDAHTTDMNCLDLRPLLTFLDLEAGDPRSTRPHRLGVMNIGCAYSGETDKYHSFFDPMTSLLLSEKGPLLHGTFVDRNAERAEAVRRRLSELGHSQVETQAAVVTPASFAELLRLAGRVDILQIDIDGFECACIAAMLRDTPVRPQAIVLDLERKVPPPFEYSLHFGEDWLRGGTYPAKRKRNGDYYFASCSISYAVRQFGTFGYYLYKYNGDNALFVHEAVADRITRAHGTHFPIDETACYFMAPVHDNFPLEYVMEWIEGQPYSSHERIWSNITALRARGSLSSVPFTLQW